MASSADSDNCPDQSLSLTNDSDGEFSTTLVTMAFDLRSLEDAPKRRPFDFYKSEGDNLIRSGLPLIIFTSPDLEKTIRKQVDLSTANNNNKIDIITVDPRQLVPRQPRITEILMKIPGIMEVVKPHTPLFTAIVWSKFTFLERIAIENPFQTTHVCWVDYGLSHIAKYQTRGLKDIVATMYSPQYKDKIHINIPTIIDWDEYERDHTRFWSTFSDGVAAGLFGGSLVMIREMCSSFWLIANSILDKGFAPVEQNIMTMMFSKDYDKYQPWFGRYNDIGINWGKLDTNQQVDYLIGLAHNAREIGFKNRNVSMCNLFIGEELSRQLLEIPEDRLLSGRDRVHLLNTMYICRWYRSPPNKLVKLTRPIGNQIVDIYRHNKECRDEIDRCRSMFVENLKHLGLTLPSQE